MLLSDTEIAAEVRAGRLVIDPPLREPDQRLQSASIDLALHNVFWRPNVPIATPGIEVRVDVAQVHAAQYAEQFEAEQVELRPGEFLLGETQEALQIPRHLAAWIEGKSGRARHGLIVHCTAPHIAPGWGTPRPKRITLEMVNLGPVIIRLTAGTSIAQLLLMGLSSPSLSVYRGAQAAQGS